MNTYLLLLAKVLREEFLFQIIEANLTVVYLFVVVEV